MFNFKRLFKRKSNNSSSSLFYLTKPDNFESYLSDNYIRLSDRPEVQTAVNFLADLVSNMTITIQENTEIGDKRINNNLSRVLDIEPNKKQTRKDFIFYIVKSMLLTGNQIVQPQYDENRNLISLEIIDMKDVYFAISDNSYQIKIKDKYYDPKTFLHFRYKPLRSTPFLGKAITDNLESYLKNLVSADELRQTYLKGKYQPPVIISVSATSDQLASKKGRNKILNDYIETSEAGEPFIIPSSMMNVETVRPLTLKDIAIIESITIDKKTIASAFGVPAFVLGVGKYNQQEYNNFISRTVMSIAKTIEQEMTKKLIFNEKQYIKFNYRSLISYSVSEKAEIAKTLMPLGIINGDEARDLMGYTPIGDKEYVMLENYIPKNKLDKQKKLSIFEEGVEG